MAFETLKASVYSLLDEISKQPEDLHVLQERLREDLAALRAMGQPLPQDILDLETWLEDSLAAERNGARKPPLPRRG
ncbi:hypothetical protein [Oceanibium sediminis]|uniref:hypothetical protein n=1 Tax=Oceanibium sediminis TaxID=2026339 RepID=UPI000DD47ECF|nr:hypothetical protein [Oceanibium sediminis]